MKNAGRILGLVCALVLLVGLVTTAQEAAKVAGKWEMSFEMTGRDGTTRTVTQTLNFEQTGEQLKGTVTTPRGETPLTGTIKGKDIKFSVTRETPGGTMTTEYVGKVEGDTMKGTFTMRETAIEWKATRAK
jgi:hypothetical protein